MSCDGCVALPRGAMGLSVVCDPDHTHYFPYLLGMLIIILVNNCICKSAVKCIYRWQLGFFKSFCAVNIFIEVKKA